MNTITAVFLLVLAAEASSAYTTVPQHSTENPVEVCCQTKKVGDYSYTKVSTGDVDPTCLNNCIYTRDGMPNTHYCFAPGGQKVQCLQGIKPFAEVGGMAGNCVNTDVFFDEMMERARTYLADPAHGFNPKALPSFSKTVKVHLPIFGEVDATVGGSGVVNGLPTIHRTGEAELCVGKTINLTASIGVTSLKAVYDLKISADGGDVDAELHASNNKLDISFEAILGPGIPGPGGLIINKFEITNLVDTAFHFTGLGIFNKAADDLVKGLKDVVSGILENIISEELKKKIQELINGKLHTTTSGLIL